MHTHTHSHTHAHTHTHTFIHRQIREKEVQVEKNIKEKADAHQKLLDDIKESRRQQLQRKTEDGEKLGMYVCVFVVIVIVIIMFVII